MNWRRREIRAMEISSEMMRRELARLIADALYDFSYHSVGYMNVYPRVEVILVDDKSWERARTRTFQVTFDHKFWKSFSLSEEDLTRPLDFISQNYLAPTAFEVIIPAIPPEILYYLAA